MYGASPPNPHARGAANRRGSMYEASIWAPPLLEQRHFSIDLSMLNQGNQPRHLAPQLFAAQGHAPPEPVPQPFSANLMQPFQPGPGANYTQAHSQPSLAQGQAFSYGQATSYWADSPWRNSFGTSPPMARPQPEYDQCAYSTPAPSLVPNPTLNSTLNSAAPAGFAGNQGEARQAKPKFATSARRHSFGDAYGYKADARSSTTPKHFAEPDDAQALATVHEYFSADPHNRVKVTAEYLGQRFFEEEKYLSDLYQLPKFPVDNTLRNYQLVLVGFKAGRIDVFYLPDSLNEQKRMAEGDLVITEADRGRDLGKIVKMNISINEARLLKLLQFLEQQAALSENTSVNDLSVKLLQHGHHHGHHGGHGTANAPPTLHFPKSILSFAQHSEILQILNKNQDEEKACRLCLAKIASATSMLSSGDHNGSLTSSDLMQMKLVDAEYQFDRRKLIFYYSTSKRIDFRDLVRELFRIYKTRIWMCAVNGSPYVPQHNQRAKQSSTNSKAGHETAAKQSNFSPTQTFRSFHEQMREGLEDSLPESRFSYGYPYPSESNALGIPRKFHATDTIREEESGSNRDSGESLVLKSLVDTLNH